MKNGTIQGFGTGIDLALSTRSTVRAVTASDNRIGMVISLNSLVKGCTVQRNVLEGIIARDGVQVEGCLIGGGGGDGGHGLLGDNRMLVTRNTASGNGGSGILLGSNSTVTHNTATGNGLNGISADQRSLVTSNRANENGRNGIVVDARTTVSFNTANDSSDDGIEAFCPATITHNTASGNDGLDINPIGTGCVIQNNNTTPPAP